MRQLATLVLVGILVAGAGCMGIGSSSADPVPVESSSASTPSPTATQTPSPDTSESSSETQAEPDDQVETADPTPVLDLGPFPSGISAEGITDSDALLSAHTDALASESFTVVHEEVGSTEEYTFSMKSTLALDGERRFYTVDSMGQVMEVYSAGEDNEYTRVESPSGVRFMVQPNQTLVPGESPFYIQAFLDAADYEFAERTTFDGQGVFAFKVATFTDARAAASVTPLESAKTFDGVLYVAPNGLIVGFDFMLEGIDFDGTSTKMAIRQSISDVGETSVTEPQWLDDAMDGSVVLSAALGEDNAYIAITMEKGDPVPAGSDLYLFLLDMPLETTMETALKPGQTFYLYEDVDGELVLSNDEPTISAIGSPVPADLAGVDVGIYHFDYGPIYQGYVPFDIAP